MSLYTLSLGAAGGVSLLVALYVWSRRPAPGAKQLTWLLLILGWWMLVLAFGVASQSVSTQILVFKLQYFSVVLTPPIWLLFVLHYTGRAHWLTRRNTFLLALMPCITLVLVWTAEYHTLIIEVDGILSSPVTAGPTYWEKGFWAWIDTFYDYILLILGTALLVQRLFRLPRPFSVQIIILLLTLFSAWMANILYVFNLIPPTLPVTPIAFAFSAVVLAWGLFRHRLLDIVPLARDVLIENMGDAVFALDAHGRLVDVNPSAQRLVRRSASEIIGRLATQALPKLASVFQQWQNGLPIETQIELEHQPGRSRSYDLGVSPLFNREGRTIGHLFVLRDVTELRAAKEQAQAADRAKTEFLSNVSHELRTPLTNLKLYVSLLQRGKPEKQGAYLATIRHETERLEALIEGLLDISRLDLGKITPQMEPVDLNDLVCTLYEDRRLLFVERDLLFRVQTMPDLPPVLVDPRLIEQVLTNLLDNALNYTPSGGQVYLTTALTSQDPARVTVSVQDTGLGILPHEQNHLFERFQRGTASQKTKTPGTGLGLAISKEIIDLHGGDITVQSQPGRGSIFTVWLPLQ
jgi:PAS domain S-box-containing protein